MPSSRAVTLANLASSDAFTVDNTNDRVGIASTAPDATLDIKNTVIIDGDAGIVTATKFVGDGSSLTGVANTDFVVSTATTTSRLVVSNGITVGVITATQFKGEGANITSLNASNLGSGTVPTARLGSGTASSSTFLRGDSTFAAVTSTTINSNANNRVITGSDSADTLEAESALTFDGTLLKLQVDSGEFRVEAANGVDAFSVDSDNGNTSIAGNTTLGIGKSVNYGNVQKAFVQDHAVGVGTTTGAGRNAGIGTAIGTVIFNTDDQGSLQVYHGDSLGWVGASNNFAATGGTETTDRSGYKVHEFTSPGTFTVSSGSKNVELMVIGGGGSGGGNPGSGANGGGGAGALYFNNAVPVSTGSYTVTIGSGGPGAKDKGDTGNASSFGPAFPAAGGGGGGMRGDSNGLPGGSGGGGGQGPPGSGAAGSASGASGGSANQNSPAAGWGHDGGVAPTAANGGTNYPAAGGGGAGAVGTNSPDQGPGQGGPGGNGLVMAIEGPSQTFAGGGGGGTHESGPQPSGGSGGGGAGGVNNGDATSGTANTGSGGGGTGMNGNGGSGGSGKVVVAYTV